MRRYAYSARRAGWRAALHTLAERVVGGPRWRHRKRYPRLQHVPIDEGAAGLGRAVERHIHGGTAAAANRPWHAAAGQTQGRRQREKENKNAHAQKIHCLTGQARAKKSGGIQVGDLSIFGCEMFGRPFAISRRPVAFQAISPYIYVYIAARSAARDFLGDLEMRTNPRCGS